MIRKCCNLELSSFLLIRCWNWCRSKSTICNCWHLRPQNFAGNWPVSVCKFGFRLLIREMYIEELKEGETESAKEQVCGDLSTDTVIASDAKRALVGAGARALFYPTLLYNVVRNKIQSEFRWWDKVDEFILLGAVPFPADVPRLKELGVSGVVTLNEPYETLVPTSLYHDNNIDHLVIPTRDYLFAPAYGDICQAVDFIHGNACCGKTTYVHCKAGRGRSTTIVLCYLVKHKHMTPEAAYEHVRSIRTRVLLASSQWQAVRMYYYHMKKTNIYENSMVVKSLNVSGKMDPAAVDDGSMVSVSKALSFQEKADLAAFDDSSMVLVTESDLEGYTESHASDVVDKNMLAELNVACRFQFAGQATIARLSCLWFRCQGNEKVSMKKLGDSVSNAQLGSLGVDIRVY